MENNHDLWAFVALLRYIDQAANDPKISKSKNISDLVKRINDALGELDIRAAYDQEQIAKVFAGPALRAVNSRNGSGRPRKMKKGFQDAENLCKEWFADPETFKNKNKFVNRVVAEEWCGDVATASRWLDEFIEKLEPSEAWLAKFEKYVKRR